MKIDRQGWTIRAGAQVVTALLLASCAGCLEKRIVWSPDGTRAAVIGERGLHLCGVDGRLSDAWVAGVYQAAWLGDSRHLVLAKGRETKDWRAIAAALDAGTVTEIEKRAELAWTDIVAGRTLGSPGLFSSGPKDVMKACLREMHGEELKSRLTPAEWQQLDGVAVSLTDVVLARVEDETVALEAVRHTGFGAIHDLRPSPRNDAVAFTRDMAVDDDKAELLVIDLRTNDVAIVVGRMTAGYPDWRPDGRALVFIEASPAAPAQDDTLVLGTLTEREVFDAVGRVALAGKPEHLARMMFSGLTHVRCLRDGRILFNAPELMLPMAIVDCDGELRDQLFALDRGRQATLVRLIPRGRTAELPQTLAFFEVSPDERQIVFGGMEGEVGVLTLATGDVTKIQDGAKTRFEGVPVWRGPEEICYVKRVLEQNDRAPARPAEVVLWRAGTETVWSRSWPDDVLAGVARNTSR